MFTYYVVLAIYFCIIFAIGIFAARKTEGNSDYVLGGRSLSPGVTALGAGASDMSGWLLLGLPGAVFVSGLDQIWLPIGLTIGAWLNWRFVAKKLRIYTENVGDAITIPSYFDTRFGSGNRTLRFMTAVVILTFFTLYAAAGFVSGAFLIQTLFDIPYTTAVWIGAIFLMVYTAIGGFLAVNWVDFFQGSLMFFALIITPVVTWYNLDPAIAPDVLPTHYFSVISENTSAIGVFSLLAWGLGYFGQPHILVRFMAIGDVKGMSIARKICMSWMIVSLVGAFAVGITGAMYYSGTAHHFDNEMIFLELAKGLFPTWIAAILIAAVLSAVMSSVAAQLLASSSAITEDITHFFSIKLSEKSQVVLGRLSVVAVSLVAMIFASNPQSTILSIVGHAWAGMGAAFGPVVLFSLFWRRCSAHGAIACMVVGAGVVIAWIAAHAAWPNSTLFSVYEIIPAFILSSAALVIVSLKGEQPSEKTLRHFDEVNEHCEKLKLEPQK
ncbi:MULTISPECIES: sodium/proline symporter PutP [unclassified Photobacterium]|uniref:sodium/proline symporter PutP n=1 Tax=unclassified Photobacterium TaxID=2628852 RepID=UPI000D177875|nr:MULTISPECIES: sodium/proline symporter PutP [unclassified Photobacterium]PSV45948.1 sodium/proline symporter PutP [Photobacterium sp. GB-36]PSV52358.1 sodium/proline symporter PutP [Photobacterium sp. GB-1]PSV52562.1 sodium/proline symporter PutP [Photobacterium sp. GB-3]PSW74377.1 sodium/proline symporter PutP [Photobacterium sp. GB-50]